VGAEAVLCLLGLGLVAVFVYLLSGLERRLEAVEKMAHAPQSLPIADMEKRLDVLDREVAVLSKGRMGRL
jgi:hypothetical protein